MTLEKHPLSRIFEALETALLEINGLLQEHEKRIAALEEQLTGDE